MKIRTRIVHSLILMASLFGCLESRAWYDAARGRWFSRDPVGEIGGINLYAYCGNNPVNFVDPFGADNLNPSSLMPTTVNNAPPAGITLNASGALRTSGGGQSIQMFNYVVADPGITFYSGLAGEGAGVLIGKGIGMVAGRALAKGAKCPANTTEKALKAVEDFLGGRPERIIKNSDGDAILMRGNKKIRFDVKDPHGDKPHFHLEEQTPSGKWRDAGPEHRYYFTEGQ